MSGGANHGRARERNGRWRQSRARIRVVRPISSQVHGANVAIIALAHTVDDGRIRLQAHTDAQAVQVQAGDLAELLRHAALFLDDRGHDQQFVAIVQRQIRIARRPSRIQFLDQGRMRNPQ